MPEGRQVTNRWEESMDMRSTMLEIARHVILERAALDGDDAEFYDPAEDPEGYVTSLLIALRHWCNAHGLDWISELNRADDLFKGDLLETLS